MTRLASRRHPRRRGGTRTASALIAVSLALGAAAPLAAQDADYRDVVPASAETARGLFDVHRVDDDILL